MNKDDELTLTAHWEVETIALNEKVDATFASAQNHAYSLGYVRGTQEGVADLLESLQMALEWIDAVPQETPLPAMPGFDRDWVNDVIAKATAKGK